MRTKTRRQAGLNRYLLGTSWCSWLCIEELIDLCNVLRANCACAIVSENTNVAEHTRTFTVFVHTLKYESTQTKLRTEISLMHCQSYALETHKCLSHLENMHIIYTLCTVCIGYLHFTYRLFTHCVQFLTVIYILRVGYFHFMHGFVSYLQ